MEQKIKWIYVLVGKNQHLNFDDNNASRNISSYKVLKDKMSIQSISSNGPKASSRKDVKVCQVLSVRLRESNTVKIKKQFENTKATHTLFKNIFFKNNVKNVLKFVPDDLRAENGLRKTFGLFILLISLLSNQLDQSKIMP